MRERRREIKIARNVIKIAKARDPFRVRHCLSLLEQMLSFLHHFCKPPKPKKWQRFCTITYIQYVWVKKDLCLFFLHVMPCLYLTCRLKAPALSLRYCGTSYTWMESSMRSKPQGERRLFWRPSVSSRSLEVD